MTSRVLFIHGPSSSDRPKETNASHTLQLNFQNQKFVPPLNFSCVGNGIFRSAYPVYSSMAFLEQLSIKTFICLCPNDLKNDFQIDVESRGIKLLLFDVKINQEPFLSMDDEQVTQAIEAAMNQTHPVLIFCLTGKVRTSCVVACMRKVQGWSFASITEEFESFADSEGGLCDLAYIHRFQPIASTATIDESRDTAQFIKESHMT